MCLFGLLILCWLSFNWRILITPCGIFNLFKSIMFMFSLDKVSMAHIVLCFSSSCVLYVANFPRLSFFDYIFGLFTVVWLLLQIRKISTTKALYFLFHLVWINQKIFNSIFYGNQKWGPNKIQSSVKSIGKCPKKSIYNQPKPYFFNCECHFWIDFNKFYTKTFKIVYILFVYLFIMFIRVVFICTYFFYDLNF